MKNTRKFVALACALALGTALAGCSSNAHAAAKGGDDSLAGQTITLYNAQHDQTTSALVAEFTKQTGVKVKRVDDDENVLAAQIEKEGSKSPADVIFTENSPWLVQLSEKGLLAKLDADTLAPIPKTFQGKNGDWVGVSARYSALVYNSDKVKASELPKSIMDLADPQWKGRIELSPSETDFWPVVSSVEKKYGKDKTMAWLKAIKANAVPNDNEPDNETLVNDIAQGTTDLVLVNHYYYYRLKAEVSPDVMAHAKIAFFAPGDAGYVENAAAAGVIKSSKHLKAAEAFVKFLTSKTGQRIISTSNSFEYPLAKGIEENPAMPKMDTLKPCDFTVQDLGDGKGADDLLKQAGLM